MNYYLFSDTSYATKKIGLLILSDIPVFLIGSLLDRRLALRSLIITFILMLFLGIYSLSQVSGDIEYIRFTGITGWSVLSHPRTLSAGAIYIICFCILQPRPQKKLWVLYLILVSYMIICAINLILADSRGPIIAFLSIVMIMSIYFWSKRILKFQHILIVIVIILFLIPVWQKVNDIYPWKVKNLEYIRQIPGIIQGNITEAESDTSMWTRFTIIKEQYGRFIKKPFLGFGLGNTDEGLSAHNIFLEILYESGIVGALIFLVIIYKIARRIFRNLKEPIQIFNAQDIIKYIFAFLFLYSTIGGLFGTIFGNTNFWFSAGMLLNSFDGELNGNRVNS